MKVSKSRMKMLPRNIEAFDAFLSGLTWTQVAKDIGVTPGRVRQISSMLCRMILHHSHVCHDEQMAATLRRMHDRDTKQLLANATFWRAELQKLKCDLGFASQEGHSTKCVGGGLIDASSVK